MNEFFEPLQVPFMRDALLVGTLVAAMCAVLSCFLILKGWSLMGDAISHAVLPGIVLAYIAGLPLAIGAFVSGLVCAIGTGFIKQNSRIKEDTVMGVVFTGMFAVGLVLFSRTPSDMHLDHILVGNILGITVSQVWQTLTVGGLVLAVTLALRRDLLLICFDPGQARVMAVPARFLNYLLLSLLSLAIVVSLQAVGIILVVAMLVTPGSIGHLWTDRFDRMLLIAVSAAVSSTVAGIFISYHIDGSTGACIVLVQALGFALSLIFAPKYGMIRRLCVKVGTTA
ncbi:MAG: metal ABC transporter permease [Akkermansiaceae bacterium]|jgi:ABC-type Mn2+/Zn2+ transport system permease subunit|nr:metal ABC transporter permease [Akkermansiaceae bacterium]